jgi:hypothetical protein
MINRFRNGFVHCPRRLTVATIRAGFRVQALFVPAMLVSLGSGIANADDPAAPRADVRVGSAAVNLVADDSMVIGGGIGPGKATGQEGELRAVAVVIEKPGQGKVAIVACDVLMMNRDLLDPVAEEIERECGIPAAGVMISCTHTHHAPTTCTVHGYERDMIFCERVQRGVVEAVRNANAQLADGDAAFYFRLGEESSVGQNSRLLLSDNTIFWTGRRDDAVRPTGPFDPELPVLAFKSPEGKLRALLFNHSTHTIGVREPGKRSPSFYGLAAQELEVELGCTTSFLQGASGSTHNLDLKADEMIHRIKYAVKDALDVAEPLAVNRLVAVKRPFTFRVRSFDEAKQEAAVVSYVKARLPEQYVEPISSVFRDMRKVLAPQQGQERTSWIQVILIGDVALVGVPAEYFTKLGQEIKRRSPFRYTYVCELANDWIGYLPDETGFKLGGYQTWVGLHCYAEEGTGERVAAESVKLLKELYQAHGH